MTGQSFRRLERRELLRLSLLLELTELLPDEGIESSLGESIGIPNKSVLGGGGANEGCK